MPHCLEFAMASPSQAVFLKSAITSQLQYCIKATMPFCLEFAMASPLQAVSLKFAIKMPLQYCHQRHTATHTATPAFYLRTQQTSSYTI
jgi:hypothetical protein